MNRQFKFRAWDHKYGIYNYSDSVGIAQLFGWTGRGEWTIQQYTGLKDKNDKEIYEGDIIDSYYEYDYEEPCGISSSAWDDFKGIVEFDDIAKFIIRAPMLRSGKKDFSEIRLSSTGIIGNIFETPELLS